MTLTIVLIAATIGLAVFAFGMRAAGRSNERSASTPATHDAAVAPNIDGEQPSFDSEATTAVFDNYFKLAFGIQRIDTDIRGLHAEVLATVDEHAAEAVHQREYFPRRPMLLPKLMRVLNDDDSTRKEMVGLILEDPALTGSVLQRANSAAYRYSPEPVDSLDRAVVMLGVDGLRSLMATAILQPVFKQPKGYFDGFAAVTWEHARRTAAAAEVCARSIGNADPFVAQLIGLLAPLARIVLFRLTMETYREHRDLQPRADVFVRAMQLQAANVAGFIAATWELSDPSIRALKEQSDRISPTAMSPLGRAVYFGELCGALALLCRRGDYSVENAQALLIQQGLGRETVVEVWNAAAVADEE